MPRSSRVLVAVVLGGARGPVPLSDITLSSQTVAEPGTSFVTIGTFSVTGGVAPYTFALVGDPAPDPGITFNTLGVPGSLRVRDLGGDDYVGDIDLTIRVTDALSATFDKLFTITIT